MIEEFPYYIEKLCSVCYKEKKYSGLKDDACLLCKKTNAKLVYVNAWQNTEFVRDFRNTGTIERGLGVESCKHEDISDKYTHATSDKGCFYAMNDFEFSVWNWMKTNKEFKISKIFNKFVAPYIFTMQPKAPCINPKNVLPFKEYNNMINPVPYSREQNESIQQEEKKKCYYCWFCLKNVISEREIKKHVVGNSHRLCYEADKKRQWYFKMPKSIPVILCHDTDCDCLAPHCDVEGQEMKARIKFRYFKFKTVNFEIKTLNPWPDKIQLIMPLFPRNFDCYRKLIRIKVVLSLGDCSLRYICLRGDDAIPFFRLYNNYGTEKGQELNLESYSKFHSGKCDFDIEFLPICPGTYVQSLEFGFIIDGREYVCQKQVRVDTGSWKHLGAFKTICEKYYPLLRRDLSIDHIVPFSTTEDTENSILTEELLRKVFRVVPNLHWFDTRVESWNYCDWMRDMMIHEELEQQLLLFQLVFIGNIQLSETLKKTDFIHTKPGQLFGSIKFKNDCHDQFARVFLAKHIVKAFLLFNDQNNNTLLFECDIVDKFKYDVESRSVKELTICIANRAVTDLQFKSGAISNHNTILFRFNRLFFDRRHKALDKMPHYDNLSYVPLCCPSFTRLPFGEERSSVNFNPKLSLTCEQKRLPLLVLRNLKSDEIVLPFILNGAFGTGKTSVVAETVRAIVNHVDLHSRVLICTRSYSAGNVYLNIFENSLSNEMLKKVKMIVPVRTGRSLSKYEIYNYSLIPEVFNDNRVFITTLDNIADSMSLVVGKVPDDSTMFNYIFVDEAAQVLEVDAIMVYQFGNQRSKFIFTGDVFQDRPEYYNLRLKMFTVPIVSRLHVMYGNCPDYEICLKEVFRSHPKLVQYLSETIYYRFGLKSSMTPEYPNLNPMWFVDSNSDGKNREEYDEDFCSYTNNLEANMITHGIETLLNELNLTDRAMNKILVCSPFYSQVKLIRDKLKKKGFSIDVEMPSAIQGREYDAVFISTVLTVNLTQGHLILQSTFHRNYTLINLIISRARHYVKVIGDKQSLLDYECRSFWEKFITFSA